MSTRPDRFSPVARTLHWTMAVLILAMLFIGVGMVSTAEPVYAVLLAWHRPIGALILLLALIRLLYRLRHPAPPLPADMPAVQKLAAKGSHWLLYASMIAMPLIGWTMLSAGGFPVRLTRWLVLPPIAPRDLQLYGLLRTAHTVVAWCFFALILLHLAAALFHALVRRDGVFESMAGGR